MLVWPYSYRLLLPDPFIWVADTLEFFHRDASSYFLMVVEGVFRVHHPFWFFSAGCNVPLHWWRRGAGQADYGWQWRWFEGACNESTGFIQFSLLSSHVTNLITLLYVRGIELSVLICVCEFVDDVVFLVIFLSMWHAKLRVRSKVNYIGPLDVGRFITVWFSLLFSLWLSKSGLHTGVLTGPALRNHLS